MAQARYAMLEKMADFDDSLMEKLLEDVDPANEEVFTDLTKIVAGGDLVPVMFGAGEVDHGVRRLLKALRHDTPGVQQTLTRLGIDASGPAIAQVLKTYNQPNIGKLSLARVWRGTISEGDTLDGARPSGIFAMLGQQTKKLGEATAGDVIALSRLDEAATGDTLSTAKGGHGLPRADVLPPVYALAISAANRNGRGQAIGRRGSIAR